MLISYDFISLLPLQCHVDGFQSTNTGGSSQVLVSFHHQIFLVLSGGLLDEASVGLQVTPSLPPTLDWSL